LDCVQNSNFNKILVCPEPQKISSIEGINDDELCDTNLVFEKKLIENLFDPVALKLAKRQKEWLKNFIEDNARPKGSKLAKYKILFQLSQKLLTVQRSKPSEILSINFDEILEKIEKQGSEADHICMNFPETIELIRKTLHISIARNEEKLDTEFEAAMKTYTDQKDFLSKKKLRVLEAINTLQVSAGISEELNVEYERKFLDEIFEKKIDKDIPSYINCLKKYQTLMIGHEAKGDLRLLLKLARGEVTEDDLKQLLMFGSAGKAVKLEKESLTKEKLVEASTTPFKVSVGCSGSGSKRSPSGVKVGWGKDSWTKDSL
jgi:hypothetical protein